MTSKTIEVQGRVWLRANGKSLLGKGRLELLRQIDATGSISRAAKAMKMSYKSAWDAVDAMNNAMSAPLVESASGGTRGGGSRLTDAGRRLIGEYERLEEKHRLWLEAASRELSLRLDKG
ncbi:LysR family transcriptional regulator [Betaproteobacteria bacterium SCN2]|jgi:molybdate transport system regulatory protein|nr:LysR family transcriptional regulator [Betaproteobacteria bacterium SCN2]